MTVEMEVRQTRGRTETDVGKEMYEELVTIAQIDESLLNANYIVESDPSLYPRQLRPLPTVSGVYALTKTEVKRDFRSIESTMPEDDDDEEDDDEYPLSSKHSASFQKKRARQKSSSLLPEELVATLPKRRKAVKLTRKEFYKMQQEHDELENTYMNLRCQLMLEIQQMHKKKVSQDRVLQIIRRKIERTAAGLEARKRRNTAMQDILMELEQRGECIEQLREENEALKQMLDNDKLKENLCKPAIGDLVTTKNGKGTIVAKKNDQMYIVRCDLKEFEILKDDIVVEEKFRDVKYDKLKDDFIQRAGAWITAEEYNSDEEEKRSEGEKDSDQDEPTATPLIPFTGCTRRTTPADVPLLLSPLSELPERVAAYGPAALEWLPSNMPKELKELEDERMKSNEQKGEIERLRFKMEQAEASRDRANRCVMDQLSSINYLIGELQELRSAKGLGPDESAHTKYLEKRISEANLDENESSSDSKNSDNETTVHQERKRSATRSRRGLRPRTKSLVYESDVSAAAAPTQAIKEAERERKTTPSPKEIVPEPKSKPVPARIASPSPKVPTVKKDQPRVPQEVPPLRRRGRGRPRGTRRQSANKRSASEMSHKNSPEEVAEAPKPTRTKESKEAEVTQPVPRTTRGSAAAKADAPEDTEEMKRPSRPLSSRRRRG